MMGIRKAVAGCLTVAASIPVVAGGALAGQPAPWQLGLQEAASPIMERMISFHDLLLVIITAIVVFVFALMAWVVFRYRENANPTPSKTSHNTTIEVLWTVIPVLILVVIAIPSFRLLYAQHAYPPADVTIKAVGRQWYWSYEYPDHGNFTFDSYMLDDGDLQLGQPRLLAVDNEVVVPVNKVVHVLVTASDVMHNWNVPAFGSKIDAIPGRVTRTWFTATRTGKFYGQCAELCGARHAFMPITVNVVTEEEFQQWLETAKQQFASAGAAQRTRAEAAAKSGGDVEYAAVRPESGGRISLVNTN
jgi:cytochrome c oxidase subunit 2